MKNTYEKDFDSLKHIIASSNGSFDNYVSNLTPTERREFLDDMDYVLGRTKSKYKKVLYVNMILFLVIGLSFINLQNNFSPISAIVFISSFGFFPTSCYQLYKNWKTVRKYKIIDLKSISSNCLPFLLSHFSTNSLKSTSFLPNNPLIFFPNL